MTLRIEETFEVRAPAPVAWRVLGEPDALLQCLRGAELTEQTGAERWAGRMEVHAGPVRLCYVGTLAVERREDYAWRLQLRADGRDTTDGAAARLVLVIALTPSATSTQPTAAHLALELDVSGRIAEFGPAVVEGVARRQLRELAERVRESLELRDDGGGGGGGDRATGESLTLSGAFREHPTLRDTMAGIGTPAPSYSPARAATAIAARRETRRVAPIARLWRAAIDRLRGRRGGR